MLNIKAVDHLPAVPSVHDRTRRAADPQIFGREAFLAEAEPLHQRDGGMVRGLDIGLEPMQADIVETMRDHQT
ncbi:hypothetical protein PY649_16320 [Rhizobium mayense]|uniref:Uncharacterized protein n=1 Tax=Rhizobium mayense TaxID=1312184 RepID=A0ABT7JVU2_9HYPH|nr:hypothetical protein [Rhizobium mayense]MDL2400471.1 hypothetical protein [Rhizobium mayense]